MSRHNRVAVRVSVCLFAKRLSCVRSRADLVGALVQRSAEGVRDIWDLDAQQKEETHTSQNIACRRSTHGGNSSKEKYGSGARHRKRRCGIEKHWLCLLMDVRRFFVQHNCMEVKYIHGTTLLLSPDPVQIEVCVLLGPVPGICSRHTTLDQVREKRPKMRPAGSLPDKAL